MMKNISNNKLLFTLGFAVAFLTVLNLYSVYVITEKKAIIDEYNTKKLVVQLMNSSLPKVMGDTIQVSVTPHNEGYKYIYFVNLDSNSVKYLKVMKKQFKENLINNVCSSSNENLIKSLYSYYDRDFNPIFEFVVKKEDCK